MKNLSIVILGLVIILALAAYMVTMQVNYNEVAVVATFGEVDAADAVVRGTDGQGRWFGNLHLRWPWPIQKVRTYDARVQVFDTRLEQILTADGRTIIPSVFLAWRIEDARAFYKQLRDVEQAERQFEARLRNALTVLSRYRFDELAASDPTQLKLGEAEQAMQRAIQQSVDEAGYGVTITAVEIRRNLLPAEVTEEVFNRMRAVREKLATNAIATGESQASNIRSEAESAREIILSFARLRADQIRAQGVADAIDAYAVFERDPEFAAFQQKLDTLREALSNQATIIADPKIIPFDALLPPDRQPGDGPVAAQTDESE